MNTNHHAASRNNNRENITEQSVDQKLYNLVFTGKISMKEYLQRLSEVKNNSKKAG